MDTNNKNNKPAVLIIAFLIFVVGIFYLYQSGLISRLISQLDRFNLAAVSATVPYTLFDGDTVPLPNNTCGTYMSQVNSVGFNNSIGLKLTPDRWNRSSLAIYCGGRDRQDFSSYQSLDFYIKSDATTPDPQTVSLYSYATPIGATSSQVVNINDYIEGGAISSAWRKVSIPISVLKTAAWDLSNTDNLNFDVSANNTIYYVDNIVFIAGSSPTNPTVQFSAASININAGQSTTLTWVSTNATGCTASGGWSGTKAISGTETISPVVTTNYNLTCNGATGTTPAVAPTVTVNVGTSPTLPITVGGKVKVIVIANIFPSVGSKKKSGTQPVGALGTVTAGPTTAKGKTWWQVNFDSGVDGWTLASNLQAESGQKALTPTASLTANPTAITTGQNTTLTWSSTNATGCTASGGWSGSKTISGSQVLSPTATTTYSLICSNTAGSSSPASVQVGVTIPTTPPPSPPIDLSKGLLIWNGESGLGPNSYGGALTSDPTKVYSGTYAFETTAGEFSQINIPAISIPTNYNQLVFYIKSNQVGGAATTFYLQDCCQNQSAWKNLASYVEGGKIDTTYRLVRIPTSEIILPSAVYLTFRKATGVVIDVDSVYAIDTIGNRVKTVESISSRVLRLTTNNQYDRTNARLLSNYELTDTATNSPVPIAGVGEKTELKDFLGSTIPPDPSAPIITPEIYLVLGDDMLNDHNYSLKVNNIRDATTGVDFTSPQILPFTYSDRVVNGTVKTNQVGFLPSAHKYVYTGNYLGDYQTHGLMPMPTVPVCKLYDISVTNPSAATPLASITAADEGTDVVAGSYSMSGEHVYSCDFKNYTNSGNYYVYVPKYGKSYPFDISPTVYNDVFKITAKGFYFQRSGLAITAPYANGIHWGAGKSWPRAAGSVYSDSHAIVHSSMWNNTLANKDAGSPLYDLIHKVINLSHGWYDASDYGKYVESGTGAIYELLTAYELQPAKYTDNQLSIPESGNGVPDLLDEIKWELDWLKEMQSPNGFVYHKVATTDWGNTLPFNDTAPRWINEKSTSATLRYAAILAKASVALQPYFPTEADVYLARAEKAYDAAFPGISTSVKFGFTGDCAVVGSTRPCNPPGNGSTLTYNGQTITETAIGGGENADAGNSNDERLWAAAELFKATNDNRYNSDFQTVVAVQPLAVTWDAYESNSLSRAGFTYARTPGANQTVTNSYLSALQSFANEKVSNVQNNTYHNGSYTTTYGTGWGAFSQSSRWAWLLVKAYELTKNSNPTLANNYLDNAKISLDVQLGGNPLNKTFITGVGYNPPMQPLHTISSLDGLVDPVPGIPIYGVQNDLTYSPWHNQVKTLTYPLTASPTDPFPIWRRYVDNRAIVDMGEFTIIDMGYTTAVYGYFSN